MASHPGGSFRGHLHPELSGTRKEQVNVEGFGHAGDYTAV
jgi:hypothetical protein